MDAARVRGPTAAAGTRGDPRKTAENAFTKQATRERADESERGRARGRAEHRGARRPRP